MVSRPLPLTEMLENGYGQPMQRRKVPIPWRGRQQAGKARGSGRPESSRRILQGQSFLGTEATGLQSVEITGRRWFALRHVISRDDALERP